MRTELRRILLCPIAHEFYALVGQSLDTSRALLVLCRAVLIEDEEERVTTDDQLQEVIHVRIENENVETEPFLQRQPSSFVSLAL